jgi:hypothetical protein
MKKINSLILIAFLFSFTTAKAETFQPGLWKSKASFKLNGIPLPSSEGEECITPDEAKDPKASIVKELKKNGCELTKWNLKGTKLEASLKCKNKDVDAEGSLRGTVSNKKYSLTGDAEGTYQGVLPSTATLALSGEWLKTCK